MIGRNYPTTVGARFVCKSCGAESPAGIGYACGTAGPLPAPTPSCPGQHYAGDSSGPYVTAAPSCKCSGRLYPHDWRATGCTAPAPVRIDRARA